SSAQVGADWISVGFPGEKVAAVARTLVSGTAVQLLELHGYSNRNKWTVDEIVGAVYPITNRTPKENATEKYLQWAVVNHVKNNSSLVGELKESLSNVGDETQQTALGRAVTDLMRNKSRSHIAIARAESLGTGLPKGPITEWDLIEAMPYGDDDLVVVRLTGAQILALVAKSQSKSGGRGYLQFSGLTTQPASLGIRIGGIPIDPTRTYTVTCSEFLAQGGDGYDVLRNARVVERIPLSAQDLFRKGLKENATLNVDGLPMNREANYWHTQLHISSLLSGRVADPSNARLYPIEPTLVGLQLISGAVDLRLDVARMTYLTTFTNFVELQYGLSLDREWIPSETVDTGEGFSQVSLNLSNLLFGGVKTLDPYVSADLQTVLLFPDPMNPNIDPSLPRPGSLKLATGLELTLFKFMSLKTGVRWENQPFAQSIPAITGLEEIVTLQADIFPGFLSFASTTDAFGAFDFQKLGITVSSKTQIFFSLQDNVKFGPSVQLFYNSLVGHVAYVVDVPLILAVTF
ncbi:MAG TPA: 5'-nucleotidase, partial [Spirochaetia bacterium]|nr:5'-nucleotidase [Spirochaetia bacterium]